MGKSRTGRDPAVRSGPPAPRAPVDPPRAAPLGPATVVGLQRAAGNRAVSAAVQREPDPAAPAPGAAFGGLQGARWQGNAVVDATARDRARIARGTDPAAVRLVQQALVDVEDVTGAHYDLGPAGVDGDYGPATGRAVQAFKSDQGLGFTQFADTGPRTLHRLDDLFEGGGPAPDQQPDDPQRFEPSNKKGSKEKPDELDREKKQAPTTLVDTLVRALSAKPPDMLIVFATLRTRDIPVTYLAVHALHDDHPEQFATLKAQLRGLTLPLAARLRVICDGVENDQDMAVLDWELSRTAQLAALPKPDSDAVLTAYDDRFPTLRKVLTSAGFQKLLGPDQDRFLVYVGGANLLSRRAGLHLATVIDGATFDRSKPETFRAYLKREETVKQLDDRTGKDPYTHRPVTRTPEADSGKHRFLSRPGGVASETSVVTVGTATDPAKATIPIVRPKAVVLNPKLEYHTFADAMRGLSVLPPVNAANVKRVDIEPGFNPQDKHWKQAYHDPNFESYMTAGADGIINIYPSRTGQTPTEIWMLGSFIHETGHIIGHKTFGDNVKGPRWKPWRDAMAADGIHPSDYAKNSPSEDFSESITLFRQVKGRRREQEIRKLFPARMALLDKLKLTQ